MKKSIIFACAALFAAAVGYDAYRNANAMDELFYANVDALAGDEDAGGGAYKQCWGTIKSDPNEEVFYCGTCDNIAGRALGRMDFCKK